MTAISVRNLAKWYSDRIAAVADLNLDVPTGSIFGFLGPNGAGKTTTISMLATLLRPTAGTAEVAGFDIRRRPDDVRRSIGIVFQESTLDPDLSAEENLRFYASLFGIGGRAVRGTIADLLTLMDLQDRRNSPVRTFSGGMRRRLEIARALLHAPKVLILDEPTTGLDPQTRILIWDQLRRFRAEYDLTVFMTTHHLEEAEHCDRIAIMDHGELVTEGTPAELKAVVGDDLVEMRTEDDEAAATSIRTQFDLDVAVGASNLRMRVQNGAALVPRLCAAIPVPVMSVTVRSPSLDDAFLHYTGRTIREEEGPRK
ncbi:ABC transporter ATP-binding protein [Micromonospora trifolii]|uniref:ABC transporter ATP-binding protein n=1 Tax=Micromonospora trifolii TaxID=2911208 RepID=UPI003D2EDD6C